MSKNVLGSGFKLTNPLMQSKGQITYLNGYLLCYIDRYDAF